MTGTFIRTLYRGYIKPFFDDKRPYAINSRMTALPSSTNFEVNVNGRKASQPLHCSPSCERGIHHRVAFLRVLRFYGTPSLVQTRRKLAFVALFQSPRIYSFNFASLCITSTLKPIIPRASSELRVS